MRSFSSYITMPDILPPWPVAGTQSVFGASAGSFILAVSVPAVVFAAISRRSPLVSLAMIDGDVSAQPAAFQVKCSRPHPEMDALPRDAKVAPIAEQKRGDFHAERAGRPPSDLYLHRAGAADSAAGGLHDPAHTDRYLSQYQHSGDRGHLELHRTVAGRHV